MSNTNIFEKGNFQKVSDNYRIHGLEALQIIHDFQF
jgi:hypothetical protein